MFEKPTVFILGAGASWHYNYPTGQDIVRRVVEKTNELINSIDENKVTSFNHIPDFFLERFEKTPNLHFEIKKFLENFIDRLIKVDPPVIDYFLQWNEDLQEIGEMMIAWVILEREKEFGRRKGNVNRARIHQESASLDERRNHGVDITAFNDNWYRFILYKIVSECKTSSELDGNCIKFITFNYDVSLETYLYQGLRQISFLKKNDGDINSFLEGRFIHMYGKIRENPFQEDVRLIPDNSSSRGFVNYKDILNFAYEASKNIKTIGDKKEDKKITYEAQQTIKWAEDVYILGYGFDENNNKRLNVENLLSEHGLNAQGIKEEERIVKNVFFTNFGDINSINKKASRALLGNAEGFLPDKAAIYKPRYVGKYNCKAAYEKSIRNVYDSLERDFDFF